MSVPVSVSQHRPTASRLGFSRTPGGAAVRRHPPNVRCLASKGGDDKSWSEIASEAGQLATDLAKKVGSSVGSLVDKVKDAIVAEEPQEERRPTRRDSERRRGDVYRPEDTGIGGGLVGGLLGRAVGGMLRSAVGALGEQLREAQEQAAEVQDRAARVIESSSKLRQQLGSVQVLPPVSQSSMTSSVNGRTSRTVTLIMPVVGSGGRTAQAQVQYVEGSGARGSEELTVAVRLPNGQVVQLDSSSSPSAQTIDVEWRSVDDK